MSDVSPPTDDTVFRSKLPAHSSKLILSIHFQFDSFLRSKVRRKETRLCKIRRDPRRHFRKSKAPRGADASRGLAWAVPQRKNKVSRIGDVSIGKAERRRP